MKIIVVTAFILTTFYLILNTFPVFAQSKILINEFLIDPQPQTVEIFNFGTESADISDWIIDDSGGTTFYTVPKDSVIFPNQCLVFSADFNLNKTSADTIRLINSSQQLIDFFSYKSSSGSGISYYRLPDGANNWATTSANLGFYNSSREQACLFPTLTSTPEPTLTPTFTPTITPTIGSDDPTPTVGTGNPSPTSPAVVLTEAGTVSYDNVYISEIMVNPPTGEKEWVEIYNDNDFSVSLKNWYIDDLENSGSSPKIFSLEISAKSYAVFNLTSSMFNNDGDSVRLLDFNKDLKDDFEYQETESGKTLGRTSFDSDDFCLQDPSKNVVNNPCINPTSTETSTLVLTTGRINPSPTKNILQTKIPIITSRETLPLQHIYPTSYPVSSEVLGLSNELIIEPLNNKPLINLLTVLSISYSLLAIVSILIKSRIPKKYALAS